MTAWKSCANFFGNHYTLFIVIVANLAVFLSGISAAWTSPVLVKLNDTKTSPLGYPITSKQADDISSLLYLGAAFGPLLFILAAEKFGRKNTMGLVSLPGIIGYLILIWAERIELFYLARVLIGFTVGGTSSVTPAYLSEIIFSVENRGSYMALNSPAIQCGYLVSYIVGSCVSFVELNCFIFVLYLTVNLLLICCCPESPYYTIETKGRKKTLNILNKLDAEDCEEELLQMEIDLKERGKKTSLLNFLFAKESLKPFVMATILLLLQQFSGIGILMTYSEQIFIKSGSKLSPELCSIIIGIIQVISSSSSTFTSKKFSRKSLLMFSLFGSSFFDLVLGLYFYFEKELSQFTTWVPLVSLICYVIIYNAALDPLPWVFLGEIYPQNLKSVGSAVSTGIYWLALYFLTSIFSRIPVSYFFLGFSLCCSCGIFFVKYGMTETKGRTLRDIQEALRR